MKKISILFLVTCCSFSCKKEYTCECKQNGQVTSTRTIEARTKKDAEDKCIGNNNSGGYLCWGCPSCALK